MGLILARVYFLLMILLLINRPAFSQNLPLRDSKYLQSAKLENFVRVNSTRVIMADYDLIRHDFEVTRRMSDVEIDKWLIENFSYISQAQAGQNKVNSPISHDAQDIKKVFRPAIYGRGSVMPVTGGLVDIKGSGALKPREGHHGDGLASLGEMIREFIMEKLVLKALNHSGSGFKTVQNYAVIDYGFNVISNGANDRAGIILRQAHRRNQEPLAKNTFLDVVTATTIEAVLRRYGISSSGEGGLRSKGMEIINIQGTPQNELIDFGAFMVKNSFQRKVTNYCYLTDANKQLPILDVNTWLFAEKPDSRLAVNFNIMGFAEGQEDPKRDRLWVYSHELAAALAEGRAQPQHAVEHWHRMLSAFHAGPETSGLFSIVKTADWRKKILKEIVLSEIAAGETSASTLKEILKNDSNLLSKEFLAKVSNFNAIVYYDLLSNKNDSSFVREKIYELASALKKEPSALASLLAYGYSPQTLAARNEIIKAVAETGFDFEILNKLYPKLYELIEPELNKNNKIKSNHKTLMCRALFGF